MNIVETILVFALIPLAIYGACALATMRSRFAGKPRYRPGQPWEYPPLWWSANPEGVGDVRVHTVSAEGEPVEPAERPARSTVRGGARGNW
ncbi:aa3-type cytochrome oxidase subunit CtaJ [Amycolatopsis aidingensis]|uniref:aa3-type cytochrome oxidase subunit CtaJ n=1 Tax=Amycolatopsis aidingensis TaxID=2842453 RepID=UPI001C0B8BE3|nr:hypothetical protein [Amycolatopsis aidingensis]